MLCAESWSQMPDAPWTPRGYAACAVFNDKVFLAGGTDLERAFSDVWTSTDARESRLPIMTGPCRFASASPTLILFLIVPCCGPLIAWHRRHVE